MADDEALRQAAAIFARALARMDTLTAEEAAREAYMPGGPSVDELAARITAERESRRRHG